jgi:ornithine cyclodeaminase/alanine dehydrogenase-like protein (mu-crystallin family)
MVVSIANSDANHKRIEVDRRTFERASAIIINDWESVEENSQTELLDPLADGGVSRDAIVELGDLFTGRKVLAQPARGGGEEIIYYKNNSGLAIQFAAAGGIIYRKALAEGGCKEIPTEWLGSDLSEYLKAGFHPSP